MYDGALADLIDQFGQLPGIGPKSAQRMAMHVLDAEPEDVAPAPSASSRNPKTSRPSRARASSGAATTSSAALSTRSTAWGRTS